jgi:hypothetical protein
MSNSNFLDQYFGDILTEGRSRNISPEILKELSKTAARRYIKDKVPLNESIMKIAQEEQALNPEHIKRIVEMANTDVYLHLHGNEEDKNVFFDIADPSTILEELGSVEKKAEYDLSDYKISPKKSNQIKTAAVNNLQDELVGVTQFIRHQDPKNDLLDLKEKLTSAQGQLLSERENTAVKMKIAFDNLYKSIKSELTNGQLTSDDDIKPSFSNIAQVMSTVSNDLSILEPIASNLMKEKIASFEDLNSSFKKIAGVIINPENSVVHYFNEYTKLASYNKELTGAIKIANENIVEVNSLLIGMV